MALRLIIEVEVPNPVIEMLPRIIGDIRSIELHAETCDLSIATPPERSLKIWLGDLGPNTVKDALFGLRYGRESSKVPDIVVKK